MLRLLSKRPIATRAFPKVVRSLATETSPKDVGNLNDVRIYFFSMKLTIL